MAEDSAATETDADVARPAKAALARIGGKDVDADLLARLRLATEAELADLFPPCELGAMPPFGNLFGLPVYVDGRLAGEDMITFNAGTHRDVIHMHFGDFERLVQPSVVAFSRRARATA